MVSGGSDGISRRSGGISKDRKGLPLKRLLISGKNLGTSKHFRGNLVLGASEASGRDNLCGGPVSGASTEGAGTPVRAGVAELGRRSRRVCLWIWAVMTGRELRLLVVLEAVSCAHSL